MPTTIYHVHVDVRGMLMKPPRELRRALAWLRKDDGSRYPSVPHLQRALLDEVAAGHDCLPMDDCDHFDFKSGCLGHPSETGDTRLTLGADAPHLALVDAATAVDAST